MDTSLPASNLEEEIAALRRQLTTLGINLSGKDWLTVDEAAHYCGVSRSQFDAKAAEYNLQPRQFMGKKLYEQAALYRSISDAKAWATQDVTGTTLEPISPGMAAAMEKLARYEKRRGRL